MKKIYFLTSLMLLLISSVFAQKELHHKKHERPKPYLEKENFKPEKLRQKPSITGEKELTKATKGEFRLDSVIEYNFTSESDSSLSGKTEYEYDADGNETIRIEFEWDSESDLWIKHSKTEYEYDANGNDTLNVEYDWDNMNNTWKKTYKREQEYDAGGNRTLDAFYSWNNTNNAWVGSHKLELEYDADGNLTLYVRYAWDSANNTWKKSLKREYEFDANGNDTLSVGYDWDSSNENWIKLDKYDEYEYDSNWNITLRVRYAWDSTNNAWLKSSKREWEYDADGNYTLQALYYWESENNTWIGNRKDECEYDADGNPILWAYYNDWDSTNNSWIADWKYEYEYDADENRTLWTYYEWNSENDVWKLNSKGYYFYTGYFTVSVDIEPEGGGTVSGDSTYKMGDEVTLEATPNGGYEFINWTNTNGTEVSNDSVYTFTMASKDTSLIANFNSIQTDIWEGEVSDKIEIYPNPAKENFNIKADNKINTIFIYDIKGSVVFNKTVNDDKSRISIVEFDTGLYILRVYTGEGIFVKKLQIQK